MTFEDLLREAVERAEAVNAHGHHVALAVRAPAGPVGMWTLDEVRAELASYPTQEEPDA